LHETKTAPGERAMKRQLYTQLIRWRDSNTRKPLLLKGARQVGKSYLLEMFGKNEFEHTHIFNFEQSPNLTKIFQVDLVPERILRELSLVAGKSINRENDLVIFDEIQECPKALTSLKYFNEEMKELALCCAGSLLGVKLSTESFPVGKVEFLHLYPMTFQEFLMAMGEDLLIERLVEAKPKNPLPEIAHDMLWQLLKAYFITGGMPQVVGEYVQLSTTPVEARKSVRKLQQALLESYYKDFAKHAGNNNTVHIVAVFENIPRQLSKNMDGSVKRYRFKDVIQKKKSFVELQGPIEWLVEAGLAIKVKVCNRAELPIETFCKENIFKLFVFDVGLLGCMLDLPVEAIVSEDYGITKGYFAENFVAQELIAAGVKNLYSWSERNSEIEFLKICDEKIIPFEVKAGTRTQAKSLQQYIQKYSPEEAIIFSRKNIGRKENSIVRNVPLYMAGVT